MRKKLTKCLKEELRALALTTRARLNLTQREMSDKLYMSECGYSEIETGVYMCGTLTSILLLAEQEDPKTCLNEIMQKFQKEYEKEYEKV